MMAQHWAILENIAIAVPPLLPDGTIFRKFREHIGKTAGKYQENWKTGNIQNVPDIFPKCSQNFLKMVHCGWNGQDILNIPLWNISVTSFPCILNFTGSVNYGYFTGDIAENTLNEPPRNTVGTFFGNILNFPTYLGTL